MIFWLWGFPSKGFAYSENLLCSVSNHAGMTEQEMMVRSLWWKDLDIKNIPAAEKKNFPVLLLDGQAESSLLTMIYSSANPAAVFLYTVFYVSAFSNCHCAAVHALCPLTEYHSDMTRGFSSALRILVTLSAL